MKTALFAIFGILAPHILIVSAATPSSTLMGDIQLLDGHRLEARLEIRNIPPPKATEGQAPAKTPPGAVPLPADLASLDAKMPYVEKTYIFTRKSSSSETEVDRFSYQEWESICLASAEAPFALYNAIEYNGVLCYIFRNEDDTYLEAAPIQGVNAVNKTIHQPVVSSKARLADSKFTIHDGNLEVEMKFTDLTRRYQLGSDGKFIKIP